MPFYEVIYETGSKSVAEYKDDETAISAVKAQHEKATTGQPGGPTGHPAERVVRVLAYDTHPGDLGEGMTMSKDVAKKELDAIMKDQGEVVNVMDLAARVRDLANPHVLDAGVHDSQYKMDEARELKLDL